MMVVLDEICVLETGVRQDFKSGGTKQPSRIVGFENW